MVLGRKKDQRPTFFRFFRTARVLAQIAPPHLLAGSGDLLLPTSFRAGTVGTLLRCAVAPGVFTNFCFSAEVFVWQTTTHTAFLLRIDCVGGALPPFTALL